MHESQRGFEHQRNSFLGACADNSRNSPYKIACHTDKLQDISDIKTCICALFCINKKLFDTYNPDGTYDDDGTYVPELSARAILYTYIAQCLEHARNCVIAGTLSIHGGWRGADTLVNPYIFFTWAKQYDYILPQEITEWLDAQTPAPVIAQIEQGQGAGNAKMAKGKKYEITQKAAANFIGISTRIWSYWKKGERTPPEGFSDELRKTVKAFYSWANWYNEDKGAGLKLASASDMAGKHIDDDEYMPTGGGTRTRTRTH